MKRTFLLFSLLAMACGLSQAQVGPVRRSSKSEVGPVRRSPKDVVGWQTDGVPVCTAAGDQQYPVIVPDQKGGGIIIWQDYRAGNWDLYAQRVDSSGNRLWVSNGVAIATGTQDQRAPKAISDMRGGAIVVYNRMDGSIWYDIWAQRVDSMGNPCWGANGVDVSNLSNSLQLGYQICSNSVGGAYITWANNDTFGTTGYDVYAQKIDSIGALQWGNSGKIICNQLNWQTPSNILDNGYGKAIITYGSDNILFGIHAQMRIAVAYFGILHTGLHTCLQV